MNRIKFKKWTFLKLFRYAQKTKRKKAIDI